MKKILYLALILTGFICEHSPAQTIKTYTGGGLAIPSFPFKITHYSSTLYGSYQYYENKDGDRVLHGKFIGDDLQCHIEGQYKHGKKDGKWVFIDQSKTNVRYSLTYKDDELNGPYEFICMYYWSLDGRRTQYVYGTFKNGNRSGKIHIDIKQNWGDQEWTKAKLDGFFDDQGQMHDCWKSEYIDDSSVKHFITAVFSHGVVSNMTELNDATGKKSVIHDDLSSKPQRDTMINNRPHKIIDDTVYSYTYKYGLESMHMPNEIPKFEPGIQCVYKTLRKYKTIKELDEEYRKAQEEQRRIKEQEEAKVRRKEEEARKQREVDSLKSVMNANNEEIYHLYYQNDKAVKENIYKPYLYILQTKHETISNIKEFISIQKIVKQLRYKDTKMLEKQIKKTFKGHFWGFTQKEFLEILQSAN